MLGASLNFPPTFLGDDLSAKRCWALPQLSSGATGVLRAGEAQPPPVGALDTCAIKTSLEYTFLGKYQGRE